MRSGLGWGWKCCRKGLGQGSEGGRGGIGIGRYLLVLSVWDFSLTISVSCNVLFPGDSRAGR